MYLLYKFYQNKDFSHFEIDSTLDESYEELIQNVNDPYAHLRYQQPNPKLQKQKVEIPQSSASIKFLNDNVYFPDDVSEDTLDYNNYEISSQNQQNKVVDETDLVEKNKAMEEEMLELCNSNKDNISVETRNNDLFLETLFNKKSKTLVKRHEKTVKNKNKDITKKRNSPRKNQDIIERNKIEVNSKNKKVSSYMQIHHQKKKSLLKKLNFASSERKSDKNVISPYEKSKSAIVEITNKPNNSSEPFFVEDEWLKQAKKLNKIRNKEKPKTFSNEYHKRNVKKRNFKTNNPQIISKSAQNNSSKVQASTLNKNDNKVYFEEINDQETNVYHVNNTSNNYLNKNCFKNTCLDGQSHQTFNSYEYDNFVNHKNFEPYVKKFPYDNATVQESFPEGKDHSQNLNNYEALNKSNTLYTKNEEHRTNETFRSSTFVTRHHEQLEMNQKIPLPPIQNKSVPHYRKYTLKDYNNLQAETFGKKLGGLGADLSSTVEKKDKQQRMVSYSNQLRSRHKKVVAKKKISMHPTHQAEIEREEEKRNKLVARQRALKYAKEVPKPKVVPSKKLENQQHSPRHDFVKPSKKLENLGDKTFTIKNSSLTVVTDENKISNDFIRQLRERHEKEKEIIARMTTLKSK